MNVHRIHTALTTGVCVALLASLLSACGSSAGLGSAGSSSSAGMSGMDMDSGSTSPRSGMRSGGSMDMGSMSMGVPSSAGEKQISEDLLGTRYWQDMKIQIAAAAPSRLNLPDGTGQIHRTSSARANLQLEIVLTDRDTGVEIPYATVQAQISSRTGKVVYHGQQLPILSSSVGSYYGDNVDLPDASGYTLKVTIDPPVAARHLEYGHIWLHPHSVAVPFSWPMAR